MRTLVALLVLVLVLVLVLAAAAPAHGREANRGDRAARYDYFVMALSWSPTFCRTHRDEREQCRGKGYGFVLHGLWPQYEGGGGPQRCAYDHAPDRRTVERALAFMPSRRLVQHEWRAHGSCSGLAPSAYFALADRAFATLQVPEVLKAPRRDLRMTADRLRASLRQANPGLRDDMMSLHCSHGELVEVRVCLDRSLEPRRCGRRMRTGCPVSAPFSIPAND